MVTEDALGRKMGAENERHIFEPRNKCPDDFIGDSCRHEIAEAFSALVFDWEARIPLAKEDLKLPEGSYDLNREGDVVYAYKDGQDYPLPDRPVTMEVEVVAAPEE